MVAKNHIEAVVVAIFFLLVVSILIKRVPLVIVSKLMVARICGLMAKYVLKGQFKQGLEFGVFEYESCQNYVDGIPCDCMPCNDGIQDENGVYEFATSCMINGQEIATECGDDERFVVYLKRLEDALNSDGM